MALLFLPIWFNLETLYPWAQPGAADEAMQHVIHLKARVPEHAVLRHSRASLFFVDLGRARLLPQQVVARAGRAAGAAARSARSPVRACCRARASCSTSLTVTFMSVDWVMSLDPHWYSTIFGVLTLGGQGLSTMAFTIIVLALLVKFQPMSRRRDRRTTSTTSAS